MSDVNGDEGRDRLVTGYRQDLSSERLALGLELRRPSHVPTDACPSSHLLPPLSSPLVSHKAGGRRSVVKVVNGNEMVRGKDGGRAVERVDVRSGYGRRRVEHGSECGKERVTRERHGESWKRLKDRGEAHVRVASGDALTRLVRGGAPDAEDLARIGRAVALRWREDVELPVENAERGGGRAARRLEGRDEARD